MIMADVFAIYGTLLALGIALPGMLLAWRLLLPKIVTRAEQRLEQTPWQCLFGGGFMLFVYLIPVIILFNLPWGIFNGLGLGAIFGLIAITSLGAAGLAGLMGRRLQGLGLETSVVGATIRGAVVLELAAVFPLIGWFIFIPLAFMISLGATCFAVLGWMPHSKTQEVAAQSMQNVPASA